ncbi:MAG: AAA family ATPase, partial [Candidatus Portiera sp.]|nr:AAA family ATPase [Portiera sp.]
MLVHLSIRDFVLVDNVSLDFNGGLSVISGESGAGKSIMIHALGLVLGERGSPNLVKEDSSKAEINAIFDITKLDTAKQWLDSKELLKGEECLLRRIISSGGGSRAFINGTPVTLEDIKELGGLVVCLHGQHAHQNLLDKKNHVSFIDDYGKMQDLVLKYRQEYASLSVMQQELAQLHELGKSDARTRDLLKHELDELAKNSLKPDEYKRLEEEHSRLSNSGDLTDTLQGCVDIIEGKSNYEEDSSSAESGVLDNMNRLTALLT